MEIKSSLTATPSHATGRTGHVLRGSADPAEGGSERKQPSGSRQALGIAITTHLTFLIRLAPFREHPVNRA